MTDKVRCSKCKKTYPDLQKWDGTCDEPGCHGIAERYEEVAAQEKP